MSVWKRGTPDGSEVSARIEEELTALRPLLHIKQATITLVEYAPHTGVAVLRFHGDCPDGEMTAACRSTTFSGFSERWIMPCWCA